MKTVEEYLKILKNDPELIRDFKHYARLYPSMFKQVKPPDENKKK